MDKYRCTVCGYIYDPRVGDSTQGIVWGRAFEDLPDTWVCPECGVGKDMFERKYYHGEFPGVLRRKAMSVLKILPNIYWVGAVDWNVRTFHGHTYTTKRGTTYNAYLILDDKIALVDTVYGPFADEMINNIKQIIPPEKIDYV